MGKMDKRNKPVEKGSKKPLEKTEKPAEKTAEQGMLFGMEEWLGSEEPEEYYFEGMKNERYFDASNLPGTPTYQPNAPGAQTFMMYVLFPSQAELVRALKAFTNGRRKVMNRGTRIGSLNAVAQFEDGKTLLEWWEMVFGEYAQRHPSSPPPPKKKGKVVDEDEAKAPI